MRYHLLDYVPAVLEAAEGLGWESGLIMGHSLGGAIAGLVAIAAPERVKAMTATIASEMPDAPHGGEHYMMLFVVGIVLLLISVVINVISDLVIKGIKKRNA